MVFHLFVSGLILTTLGAFILAFHSYTSGKFSAKNYSSVYSGTLDGLKKQQDELKKTNRRKVEGASISLGVGFILAIIGVVFEILNS